LVSKPDKSFKPALVWAIVIFILSSWPGTRFPDFAENLSDKWGHLVTYSIFGILLANGVLKSARLSTQPLRWFILAFVVASIYGALLELMQDQLFISRHMDSLDMTANAIGSAIGLLVGGVIFGYVKKR